MADLRDEHGNPIQLTDQYGKPVELKDEYGNPMYLTGVATTPTAKSGTAGELAAKVAEELSHEETASELKQPAAAVPPRQQEQIRRSGSSSSSSSSEEDDGQGGRRKKKGSLKEKLMSPFTHKDKGTAAEIGTTTTQSKTSTTVPGEHEKKGFMEKIKEKLPGHHHVHQGKGTN